jgi:hypothetical protein
MLEKVVIYLPAQVGGQTVPIPKGEKKPRPTATRSCRGIAI